MSKHLTPLQVCVALIAPMKDLGELAGLHQKSAYHWRSASAWRAAGDLPPPAARRLLRLSRSKGFGVEPLWLLEGAPVEDVARVLAGRGLPPCEVVETIGMASKQLAAA